MSIFIITVTILLLAHIFIAAYMVSKTAKTIVFTKAQKIYNIILIIIFPFFWSALIYYMLKKEPYSYEIEVKNDVSSNRYYESGYGAPGAGIGNR
jgi:prolipoprotein diacylglyceryltransferase